MLNLETAPYLQDNNPEYICLNRGLQKVLLWRTSPPRGTACGSGPLSHLHFNLFPSDLTPVYHTLANPKICGSTKAEMELRVVLGVALHALSLCSQFYPIRCLWLHFPGHHLDTRICGYKSLVKTTSDFAVTIQVWTKQSVGLTDKCSKLKLRFGAEVSNL